MIVSTWNHRVMRSESDGETSYGVHEVYYDDDGSITFWTLNPVAAVGDTVDDLQEELLRMLAACAKNPLDVETGDEL